MKSRFLSEKKTIILTAAAIAFTIGACNNSSSEKEQHNESGEMHEHENDSMQHHDAADSMHQHDDASKNQMSEAMYQCPMHPEVTSDKPGKCSTCGMDLEQKK
ncbi:MAG: heavy metal-binding domain-containing protein [Bacteroidia bacterium]